MINRIRNWLWRRRAAREWRIVERWCNPVSDASIGHTGTTWIVGEINGLGAKRIRIIDKGSPKWMTYHTGKAGTSWFSACEWATRPEPIDRPKLRVIK